jgi:hypothetical protein
VYVFFFSKKHIKVSHILIINKCIYVLCILKFQQLKLKVWRRLRIPFRFLSWRKLPKLIFRYSTKYILYSYILAQITYLNLPIGGLVVQITGIIKLAQNTISQ